MRLELTVEHAGGQVRSVDIADPPMIPAVGDWVESGGVRGRVTKRWWNYLGNGRCECTILLGTA